MMNNNGDTHITTIATNGIHNNNDDDNDSNGNDHFIPVVDITKQTTNHHHHHRNGGNIHVRNNIHPTMTSSSSTTTSSSLTTNPLMMTSMNGIHTTTTTTSIGNHTDNHNSNHNNNHNGSIKSVDDAKYDRRIKQRLLLRNQRLIRRKKMNSYIHTICKFIIRIILIIIIIIGVIYMFYSSSSTTTNTRRSNINDVHHSTTTIHLQHQQDQHHHHQQQILPPLPILSDAVNDEGSSSTATEKSSSLSYDIQFQQLRTYFLDTAVTNNQNNQQQQQQQVSSSSSYLKQKKQLLINVLLVWLQQMDNEIHNNIQLTIPRYIRPYLLPPLPNSNNHKNSNNMINKNENEKGFQLRRMNKKNTKLPSLTSIQNANFFRVHRFRNNNDNNKNQNQNMNQNQNNNRMKWMYEYEQLVQKYNGRDNIPGPKVDYTNPELYTYPKMIDIPPMDGSYPKLISLHEMLMKWPQNDDYNVNNQNSNQKIIETIQHFDYQNATQLHIAKLYRDAELPFKLYNIPDINKATMKWKNDTYISQMFGNMNNDIISFGGSSNTVMIKDTDGRTDIRIPTAKGTAQESRDHYFAFYVAKSWNVETMGIPPTRNIMDWNYTIWSNHARYADAVSLSYNLPHFYWQAGVPPEERDQSSSYWTFISRDLPIFSTNQDNFFVFHVKEQKGIQCRFGERGVVAATHFDSGRNMVGMITGAKRYILSPPNQCSKLGIFTNKRSPIYRHSLLNFGHIPYIQNDDNENTINKDNYNSNNNSSSSSIHMSMEEREWLKRAASSQAVETVLKQGEVLYIPSHWFHYIISLQKSAQCNVRSGIDMEGTTQFGGRKDVDECI